MSDRQEWLRENLPTMASAVDEFALAFGRSNLTVTYAKEAGHVLGKEPELSHPCHACRHSFLKLVSPDGKHIQRACDRYRGTVEQRCADWSER
jgi:hypothetical protein